MRDHFVGNMVCYKLLHNCLKREERIGEKIEEKNRRCERETKFFFVSLLRGKAGEQVSSTSNFNRIFPHHKSSEGNSIKKH
jgi:hypothetical protein